MICKNGKLYILRNKKFANKLIYPFILIINIFFIKQIFFSNLYILKIIYYVFYIKYYRIKYN